MVQPGFDTWIIGFLVVSLFGIYLSIKLIQSRSGNRLNLPMIFVLLGFSIILVQYVAFWTGYKQKYPWLYGYDSTWYLLFGPLLYQYVVQFYHAEYRIRWMHYLPAGVLAVLTTIYFVKTGGRFFDPAVTGETLHYFFRSLRSPWVGGISLGIYIFTIQNFIAFHRTDGNQQYTKLRDQWARWLLRWFSVFTLAYLSYFTLVRFEFFNTAWDYAISFTMTIGIYGLSYFVIKEPSIFNGMLWKQLFLPAESKNGSGLTAETETEFYQLLLTHMQTKQPYLDNQLRLVTLADQIGLSAHTVSHLINLRSGMNFNQFVNNYRLSHAETLLKDNSNTPIKQVYFNSGFNNKATFYKVFRSKHKCTPSEYQNRKGKG
ncbi:AraC family transcriptional regulator [Altibacter sp. HG106]|uniref:AraC family transcriptional regulator n=1 Tax=Altibacter sp. HG106 TaxID=3023937 RepID=UPI00234FFBC1|nr:helix-turn-helix domain-containing protein [Altibacter sp. HG106]MDC7994491.1 helix-turn-helix domain-containing protein [Altibacter sp. HG106]